MKQTELTALALRKIYHAEQLGMPAVEVKQLRDTVESLNRLLDDAVGFVTGELVMLDSSEQTALMDRSRDDFTQAMSRTAMIASGWIKRRVRNPGGLKAA